VIEHGTIGVSSFPTTPIRMIYKKKQKLIELNPVEIELVDQYFLEHAILTL